MELISGLHHPSSVAKVLAEALFGFIDVDRNGKIDGGELKVRTLRGCLSRHHVSRPSQVCLAMLGFPAAMVLPIPKAIGVDYRGILRALGSEKS